MSSSLFLSAYYGSADHLVTSSLASLGVADGKQMADLEIVLLNATAAYARRLCEDRKICAVGTGVSYETLSGFHARIRYITALQKLRPQPATPLVLKIEQIPEGTPAVRIGELAAMLVRPNVRVTLEFQSLRAVPAFNFRLYASGLGGEMPKDADRELVIKWIKSVVSTASAQKAFVFLDRLDTPDAVSLARKNQVRFGTGAALGTRHLSGIEPVPKIPLT